MTELLKRYLKCMFLLTTFVGSVLAAADDVFPGQAPDRRVMKAQEMVDSLFEKGDFDRAMFIYREDLAPLGDKYAQYMIGYMYLTGKGVTQDLITASAWYRLAAERGNHEFASARDEVMLLLNDEARSRSDSAYIGLRRELSDAAIVSRLIREDLEILRRFTQSRPPVMRRFEESFDKRTPVYEPVVDRLQQRLNYLIDLSLSDEFDSATEQQSLNQLEAEVIREIQAFELAK